MDPFETVLFTLIISLQMITLTKILNFDNEVTKLKIEIIELKSKVNQLYHEVYKKHDNGEVMTHG